MNPRGTPPGHAPNTHLTHTTSLSFLAITVRHRRTFTTSSRQRPAARKAASSPGPLGIGLVLAPRMRPTAAMCSVSGAMWALLPRGSLPATACYACPFFWPLFIYLLVCRVPRAVVRDRHAGRREARAVPAQGPMQADFFRHQADIWQAVVG